MKPEVSMQSGYEKLAYRNNLSGVKDIALKIHNLYHLINKKQWGFIILESHKDMTMAGLFLGWGVGFSFLSFLFLSLLLYKWKFSTLSVQFCSAENMLWEACGLWGEIIFSGEKRIETDFFFSVKFKTLLMLLNWYIILMPLRTPIIKNSPEFSLVWVSLFSF